MTDDLVSSEGFKILCIIPALGAGGAERVMVNLSGALSSKHNVSLLNWQSKEQRPFYELDPRVRLVSAGLLGGVGLRWLLNVLSRLPLIRREITNTSPDIVISFMDTTNITVVGACLGNPVPLIVSERVDPEHHRLPLFKSWLRIGAYAFADYIVVPTERVKAYFPKFLQNKIIVIANPVTIPEFIAIPDKPNTVGRFRLVGLGRLEEQKGFGLLIDSFSMIARKFENWDLIIFGVGSKRPDYDKKIEHLGLCNRIFLAGLTKYPEAELAASHILAFPSLYEGFPNALAEGVAVGLPAVAFSGVSGVEDLIVNNKTGLIVPREGGALAFAKSLEILMKDANLRYSFGSSARIHAKNWDASRIYDRWNNLIKILVNGKSKKIIPE